jgi:two-component system sensor kinase FixL
MLKHSADQKRGPGASSKTRKKIEPVQPPSQVLHHAHTMIREPTGRIEFWARGLEGLYGFTSAQAVGRISHKLLNTEFPVPLKHINEELLEAGEWNGELAQRKCDGGTVVVASHWALWHDRKNKPLVIEVSNEIHQHPQAYLADIVESSDDAIVGKTLEGVVTSWNRAAERIFGYKAAEIRGKSVTLLIPSERIAEEREILKRIKDGERIDHYESVRLRKDGREIIVSLTISPIRDWKGQIIGASKIARDITEQNAAHRQILELQSELAHASRLSIMGQMVATITHELNQPLTAVDNYLSGLARLLSRVDTPSSVTNALAKAYEQNKRSGEIVHRLRDFIVKRAPNRRAEDLNDILKQTLALALIDSKLRRVTTRLLLAPDLESVLADRVQIGQVILNIVRNAIEAMESSTDRTLTIFTLRDPKSPNIEMRISDTGPGLTPQVKERLFQPYVTTKGEGMGIGLSICHEIVESHNGSLTAEPNAPHGTTFVIRLPLAETGTSTNSVDTTAGA